MAFGTHPCDDSWDEYMAREEYHEKRERQHRAEELLGERVTVEPEPPAGAEPAGEADADE